MALNFPPSPSVNDEYTDPNGAVWRWNGSYWQSVYVDGPLWFPTGSTGLLATKAGASASSIGVTAYANDTGKIASISLSADSGGDYNSELKVRNGSGGTLYALGIAVSAGGTFRGPRVYNGGAYVKVWYEGNDGAGSTLDADLLDGQEGSYYQNAGNLNAGTIPDDRISTSTWPARTTGTWTPTITANTGGPPTVTINAARWERHGNIKEFYIDASVTALNGSGGFYNVTLPDTVTYAALAIGRNEQGEWIMGRCPSSSNTMIVQTAAAGFPTGATHQLILRGSYEM